LCWARTAQIALVQYLRGRKNLWAHIYVVRCRHLGAPTSDRKEIAARHAKQRVFHEPSENQHIYIEPEHSLYSAQYRLRQVSRRIGRALALVAPLIAFDDLCCAWLIVAPARCGDDIGRTPP
jgi:hypothetical protein